MKYYSQFGEDQYLFVILGTLVNGVFVDVGAGDGVTHSNTKLFEDMGWSGICIEPDARNYAKCKMVRKNVLNLCISNSEKETLFYTHRIHPDLSGLNKSGPGFHQVPMKPRRLDSVLKEQEITHIDLLSVDTEGTELDVMDSFICEKYSPSVIVIEYVTLGHVNYKIESYFEELGTYDLIRKHGSNLMYVRKGFGYE